MHCVGIDFIEITYSWQRKSLHMNLLLIFLIFYENFQFLYPSAILFNTFTALRIISNDEQCSSIWFSVTSTSTEHLTLTLKLIKTT
jgi:hypothetical protein